MLLESVTFGFFNLISVSKLHLIFLSSIDFQFGPLYIWNCWRVDILKIVSMLDAYCNIIVVYWRVAPSCAEQEIGYKLYITAGSVYSWHFTAGSVYSCHFD